MKSLALFFLLAGSLLLLAEGSSSSSKGKCLGNRSYQRQVDRFIYNATRLPQWERANIPCSQDLFEYGCSRLEPIYEPQRNLSDDANLLDWWLIFLQYNYWETEEGRLPYVTEFPFSWEFLDAKSIYRVPDIGVEVVGRAAIEASNRGLGRPSPPEGDGAGFYVKELVFNDAFVGKDRMFNARVIKLWTLVHKTLVTINFAGSTPNTTSRPLRYQMVTSYVLKNDYPKIRFVNINETINTQATLELFGVCFLCVNCPPGGQCPPGPGTVGTWTEALGRFRGPSCHRAPAKPDRPCGKNADTVPQVEGPGTSILG